VTCTRCGSLSIRKFKGEVAILLPEPENRSESTVLVWPELVICMACGFAEFVIPGRELRLLAAKPDSTTG
jgi:hypothetical protein